MNEVHTIGFTEENENFLLADTSEKNYRILIFSNLELLVECEPWFADGTFKTVPTLFEHVYTVHGLKRYGEGYSDILLAIYTQ